MGISNYLQDAANATGLVRKCLVQASCVRIDVTGNPAAFGLGDGQYYNTDGHYTVG